MTPCPTCGFDNPEGFRFCGNCGEPLGIACPSCGAEVPAGFRFCGRCGSAVAPTAESARPSPFEAMPSERRKVTVLFADLVGFSTLAEHLDPEELRTFMTETFGAIAEIVEGREGVVEKFIGDAVMAVFGAPTAHEDDPDRALETAFDIHDAIEFRSRSTPAPLQIRIGINSGLVVSGTVGDGTQTGVMGDAVNVAARLQQAAAPGEVLVSGSVWRRIRARYDTASVGALEVKGRVQPVDAYRVLGPSREPVRKQSPFVGRKEELALLELLWSSAAKGNTHIVSVVGEPGVGKSRLLEEFDPHDGHAIVRVNCSSERAFGPFLELVERLLGGRPRDVDELKKQTGHLDIDAETAVLLAGLLGLAGAPPGVWLADEQQRRQVFAGLWRFLVATSTATPTLLVLEDLHWADASSLDLLGFLLERVSGAPLMIVVSYRPGFESVERASPRASHTAIRLDLLSPEESLELARGFLDVEALPEDLERAVVQRAEGNPFFIEELLQALLELGSLAVVDASVVFAKVEVDIPDTVEGTILARVDRLAPRERSVLQHAAIIGRTFGVELLHAVTNEEALRDSLDELARAQLIVEQGPDEWTFKHALIQEVTYDRLLLRQRKELHHKVADALERISGDDPRRLELLAEHYALAEVPEKARSYALRAGDLARERMGYAEAARRYQSALRLWGEGDHKGRLELLENLGHAAHLGGDATTAVTSFIEAEAGYRDLGETRRAGAALAMLARAYWTHGGETARARETIERAIETLEPEGASPELVAALTWASTLHMLDGNVDEGAAIARRGLDIERNLGLEGFRSHLLNTLGVCEASAGDFGGVARLREALALAESCGEPEAIGRAFVNLPSVLWMYSQNREGVEICERGRDVMRRIGSPSFEWFIAANQAHQLMDLGRYDEAEALAIMALERQREISAVPGIVDAAGALVFIYTRTGRYEEARTMANETLPLSRRVGGADFLASALAQEAELEMALGHLAAARRAIREAVDTVLVTPSVGHGFQIFPIAARLLKTDANKLLERARRFSEHPAWRAQVEESDGLILGDPALSRTAADHYRDLELPYEEARCRIDAGDFERAREIVSEFGLEQGPLGQRLLDESRR